MTAVTVRAGRIPTPDDPCGVPCLFLFHGPIISDTAAGSSAGTVPLVTANPNANAVNTIAGAAPITVATGSA